LLSVMAGVLPMLTLLAMTSVWWAWHGVWGWGPRLLVPAVPMLAAVAAPAIAAWRRPLRIGFVAASVLINVPGLAQHPVPVATYVSNLSWPAVTESFAKALPEYALRRDPGGTLHASPDHILASLPRASPFIVFPWFWNATVGTDGAQAARTLQQPPWAATRQDLVPSERPMSEALLRDITGPPRWRFWGRGFSPSAADAAYAAVYDEALADQVIRLQMEGHGGQALAMAARLVRLAPIGAHDALVLESHRILGDGPAAKAYLVALPLERRADPAINVVLALFERDAGRESGARQFLSSVAGRFPAEAPVHRALRAPIVEWPGGLQSMIAQPVKAAGSPRP
jgi:hypothetical protein